MYGSKSTVEVPTIAYAPRYEAVWRGGIALIILKLFTTLTITLFPGKGSPLSIGQEAGWAQNRCGKCGRSRNTYTDMNLDFHLFIVVY
jgi:hypothetical protein